MKSGIIAVAALLLGLAGGFALQSHDLMGYFTPRDSSGTPPQPHGCRERFALVAGQIQPTSDEHLRPALYRIDTWTGACWSLDSTPFVQNGKVVSEVRAWTHVEEHDGELLSIAFQNLKRAD